MKLFIVCSLLFSFSALADNRMNSDALKTIPGEKKLPQGAFSEAELNPDSTLDENSGHISANVKLGPAQAQNQNEAPATMKKLGKNFQGNW